MTAMTRRSLLGGVAALGAGVLTPQVAHAGTSSTTSVPTPTKTAGVRTLQSPPRINVLTNNGGTAPGYLLLSVNGFANPNASHGLVIADDQGQVQAFRPVAGNLYATDFRVQTYQGRQVLTWWEGPIQGAGVGNGTGYIADANFNVIATVGQGLDLHEFRLTDQGTALTIAFETVQTDLSSVGGPPNGSAYNCVVREIDVATGQTVFEWSSLDHVPVSESGVRYNGFGTFDYIHVNSVVFDIDGNLLISGRFTNTLYKVDRTTGEVLFRLGGGSSSFQMGSGASFIGQHDGESDGNNTYRVFDNGINFGLTGEPVEPGQVRPTQGASRVLVLQVGVASRTANRVAEIRHPQNLMAFAEGGSERLSNGNILVSWGSASRISEFSSSGQLLFDASLDQGLSSYRAYRFEWQG